MKIYHIAYEPTYKSIDFHIYEPCNLSCRGCYVNFETSDFGLMDDPVEEMKTKERAKSPTTFLTYEEVIAKIKDLDIKYAVFMGTEAVLDPELPRLCKYLKEEKGAYILVLTNAVALASDMTYIDEFIVSLKAIDPRIHKYYTGVDNQIIKENFRVIHASGKKIQAECVLIPGLVGKEEVARIAEFVGSVDANIMLRIDAYFPVPGCPWEAASNQEVEEAAEMAKRYVKNVNCLMLDMKRIGEKAVKIF